MKAVFVLGVLLSGALALTAVAAVEAVEPAEAPVEPEEENQVEAVPEEGEPEGFSARKVEVPASVEARYFFCPIGWERYKHSCYLSVRSFRSWTSATAYCASLGATLPSASDLFEYSFLQTMTTRAGYTTSWLGGLYFQGWKWLDGTKYGYQNWHIHNNVRTSPCMFLNAALAWSNSNCALSRAFICQKKSGAC